VHCPYDFHEGIRRSISKFQGTRNYAGVQYFYLMDGAHMAGQRPVGGGLVVALLALVAEILVTLSQVVPQ
jgi:hypothetical protein